MKNNPLILNQNLNISFPDNLVGLLEKAAKLSDQDHRGITYVQFDGSETHQTYRQLFNKSIQLSVILKSIGISAGQHLIFQLSDIQNFIQFFWGAVLSGIIPIPLTFNGSVQTENEAILKLINVIDLVEDATILTDDSYLESFKTILKNHPSTNVYSAQELLMHSNNLVVDPNLIIHPQPKELAFIQFSSGSTGTPKGVMLTHNNLVSHFKQIHHRLGDYGNSSSASWMPLTHDMGLIGFHLSPLAYANNHLLMAPDTFIRKPLLFLEKVSSHKSQIIGCPNFALSWILDKLENKELKNIDLSHVRLIFNGAEPICMDTIRQFNMEFIKYGLLPNTMYPVYGMAEACIAVTMPEPGRMFASYCLDRNNTNLESPVVDITEHGKFVEFADVGFAVDDLEIKIVNDLGKHLPDNMIGNITIKGPNVTLGYYKNPQANEELFINGYLKTGDLGFMRKGRLAITGRNKDIIFSNGHNYYSHDLERIIEEIQNIGNGKVAVCPIQNECDCKDEIVVFLQYRKSIANLPEISSQIQEVLFVKTGLPVKHLIPVKSLPRTTSGKLQRFKLVQEFKNGGYNHVINEISQFSDVKDDNKNVIPDKLLDIWHGVFKMNTINANTDFFALGGNSLKMMEIIYKINCVFGIDISVGEFVKHTTLKSISAIINKKILEGQELIYPRLNEDPIHANEPFGLTGVQMAYLMGRREEFEMGGISTHAYYEIATSLDLKRFNHALNQVIKRQGMLRAIVHPDAKQQVLDQVPLYQIAIEDISMLDKPSQETKILEKRGMMSHHVFQTDKWPLFEFSALKLGTNSHILFVGFDLLIADGTSMRILMKELIEYYQNPGIQKEPLIFSFRDYVRGLVEFQKTGLYQRDRSYWLGKLDGFPSSPSLPLKKDPSMIKNPRFRRLEKQYDKQSWEKLKKAARENSITPSAIICTAYSKVLSFWSNQPDMAINLTVFIRYPFHMNVMQLIGDFTSIMLIDISLNQECNFWDSARTIQGTMIEALEHRHYDGIEFIREISRNNNLGTTAVMPYVFTSMLFDDQSENSNLADWGEIRHGVSQTSQVYLDCQALESNGKLYLTWDYVEDLLETKMMEIMFDQYINILESAMEGVGNVEPRISIKDKELLVNYNKTSEPIKQTTLTRLFIEIARRMPENIAVIDSQSRINYRELDKKSNLVANYLKQNNIGRGCYVGVIAKRQKETIVNILGILKSGAAYVPIDPDFPIERKTYILKNSGCKELLDPNIFEHERLEEHYSGESLKIEDHPEDIAYAIYTSGSTGHPKGVIVQHGAVCNTIIDINQKFKVEPSDRIIGLSSMCFDLSVYDIFGSLSTGAALVQIVDILNLQQINKLAKQEKITIWNSVPAIMEMHIENLEGSNSKVDYWEISQDIEIEWQAGVPLRVIMLSGDWIPLGLPDRVREFYPLSEIISLGGATEASIWSIYYPIGEIQRQWKSIPYGVPLANQTFHVLNYQMEDCPVEVQGELYIGGVGVAAGYMSDKDRTRESFPHHPVHGIIYKTGDYGVMHPEGYIEFLGRKDQQVKIRGHRIELSEIEANLMKIGDIQNALVIDRSDPNGKKYLCAYIVTDKNIEPEEFKNYLLKYLPEYMVPSYFVKIGQIPLTPNGKTDRKALPEPELYLNNKSEIEAPRTTIEKDVLEIWKNVLGLDIIGINDNFFTLGGDSIKAVRIYNLLQQRYKIDIRTLFQNQTIALLSKQLIHKDTETEKSKYSNIKSMFDKKNITYDLKYKNYIESISNNQIEIKGQKNFKYILLTGSTGYLGCHILKDLLENTHSQIVLIVRGDSQNEAVNRQKNILNFYFKKFNYSSFNERISIYSGDLCKVDLGLNKSDYINLSEKIECIINAAALVKHLGNYNEFRKYNIEIVNNLLKFEETGIKKEFHQISTSLLGLGKIEGQKSVVFTENDLNLYQNYDDFYIKSKFEAEKILEIARKKGIVVNIYRVGNITFHSQTGHFQRNIHENTFYQMIKLFIEQKIIPGTSHEILDFCYVDYVSKALTLLFDKEGIENMNFHLINSKKISFKDLGVKLQSLNKDINIVEIDSFIDIISNLEKANTNMGSMINQLLVQIPYFIGDKDTDYIIPSEMTETILKKLGFEWFEPDQGEIKKMIEYASSLNFINGGKND